MFFFHLDDTGVLFLVEEDGEVVSGAAGHLHELKGHSRVGVTATVELDGLRVKLIESIAFNWIEHFLLLFK